MPLWFKDVWAKTLADWLTQCRDRQTDRQTSGLKKRKHSVVLKFQPYAILIETWGMFCMKIFWNAERTKMEGKWIAENKRERNRRRKWCKPLFSSNTIEWQIQYQFNSAFIAVFHFDWSLIRCCTIVAVYDPVLLNLSSGIYSHAKWQTDHLPDEAIRVLSQEMVFTMKAS